MQCVRCVIAREPGWTWPSYDTRSAVFGVGGGGGQGSTVNNDRMNIVRRAHVQCLGGMRKSERKKSVYGRNVNNNE